MFSKHPIAVKKEYSFIASIGNSIGNYEPTNVDANPILLGPENVLTHSQCLIFFGGLDDASSNNDLLYLDCRDFSDRNRTIKFCLDNGIVYSEHGRVFKSGMEIPFDADEIYEMDEKPALHWKELQVSGVRPPPMSYSTLVYDVKRQKIYSYGGYTTTYSDELWQFDLSTKTWSPLESTGTKPGKCVSSFSAITHDLWIVMGGYDGRNYSTDTYLLDLTTKVWTTVDSNARDLFRQSLIFCHKLCISNDLLFTCLSSDSKKDAMMFNTISFNQKSLIWENHNLHDNTYNRMSFLMATRGKNTNELSNIIACRENGNLDICEFDPINNKMIEYELPNHLQDVFWKEGVNLFTFELDEDTVAVLSSGTLYILGVSHFKQKTPANCFRNLYKPLSFSDIFCNF